eukprot:1233843-Rhodomonas_salina.1
MPAAAAVDASLGSLLHDAIEKVAPTANEDADYVGDVASNGEEARMVYTVAGDLHMTQEYANMDLPAVLHRQLKRSQQL